MSLLDHIASFPYRIFGICVVLIGLAVSIPVILIPSCLNLITQGRTFQEAYELGHLALNGCSLKEMFEAYEDTNNPWLKVAGFIFKKLIWGICLVVAGVYYEECYFDLMDFVID